MQYPLDLCGGSNAQSLEFWATLCGSCVVANKALKFEAKTAGVIREYELVDWFLKCMKTFVLFLSFFFSVMGT